MNKAKRSAPEQDYRYGWIGVAEAMHYLGLRQTKTNAPAALYRLINEHALPHGRMGMLYRFRRADLDAWMLGHQSALTAAQPRRDPDHVSP